jgi:MYXO-CTERM domain-containing protein
MFRRPGLAGRLAVALALPLLAGSPSARAAIVAEGATSAEGVGTSITVDHTVGAAADRYLLVGVGVRSSGVTIAAVTFAGRALAPIVSASAGGYCRAELWGLAAPPPGTAPVVVTLSGGSSGSIAAALSYAGVDGTAPVVRSNALHGTRGAVSLPVASAAGELVVDSVCGGAASAPTAMAAAGQTERWNRTSGSLTSAGSDRPGATSGTMDWTLSVPAALGWSIAAAVLRPATSASPPPDGGPGAPDDGGAFQPDGQTLDGVAAKSDGGPTGDGGGLPSGPGSHDGSGAEIADAGPGPPAVTHLRVGCACRAGGRSGAGGAWLLVAVAAWRRRRISGGARRWPAGDRRRSCPPGSRAGGPPR